MQQTKKLEENKIKTRQQNKGRKIKAFLLSPIHLAHHRSAVAPLSLRCHTNIATLSLCCRSAAAPISHRYRSTVAPILSLLLLLRCCTDIALLMPIRSRTAIAPLSLRCRTAVAPAQRGYKQFNIELLLLYCHSTVASAVNRKVHTVVPSRGIIRVTVTISDCQARVSSSLEGCSTWQKTVNVEA